MQEKIKNITKEYQEKNDALIISIIDDIINVAKQKFNEVIENYNKAAINLVDEELNKSEISWE